MENHYETLHVANFAEIEIVKAAYKAITKLYHPDVNKTADPSIMVQINLAYEVLGDSERKKEYDMKLKRYLKTVQCNEKRCSNDTMSDNDIQNQTGLRFKKQDERLFKSKFANTMFSAARFVGKSFINSINQFQREYENAYLRGGELSNERLVNLYLKSVGASRNGYAQVLIERGLLYKEDGKLVPSYTFRQMARR